MNQEARNLENLRIELSTNVDDIWNEELSFAQNVKSIIEQSVAIPDKKIQLPIIVSYSCLPSALCTVVPILFLQGREGTGKSTIAIVLSAIFGQEIFSAATSFAAIRNAVQNCRWYLPESQEQERNFGICFDNVNANTFRDESLYTFFLNGNNRKTDRMEISNGDGTNILFKVFCPKICTSIHPLYSEPRLCEISRRMLPIKFRRVEDLDPEDLDDFDVFNRLDVENVDLGFLNEKFNVFWNPDNAAKFMELKRSMTGKGKKIKPPRIIKGHQWSLTIDMICAGVVAGLWVNPEHAIEDIKSYWEWHGMNISSKTSSFSRACKQIIDGKIGNQRTIDRELGIKTAIEIGCNDFQNQLKSLASSGALDENVTPRNVTDAMSRLGWHREQNKNGDWVWVEMQ